MKQQKDYMLDKLTCILVFKLLLADMQANESLCNIYPITSIKRIIWNTLYFKLFMLATGKPSCLTNHLRGAKFIAFKDY